MTKLGLKRLKNKCKRLGIRQIDIAARANRKRSTVTNWFAGRHTSTPLKNVVTDMIKEYEMKQVC